MTVYKPLEACRQSGEACCARWREGSRVTAERFMNNGRVEVPSILLPPVAVDAENIDETIIADGFHSWEDVYQAESE